MARFMITYFGGDQPASPEEGQRHFTEYQQWLNSLGEAAVSPMNPLTNTHTLNPDGSSLAQSSSAMSGYTVVKADSMAEALSLAKACPFLKVNGTLEVAEMVEMG